MLLLLKCLIYSNLRSLCSNLSNGYSNILLIFNKNTKNILSIPISKQITTTSHHQKLSIIQKVTNNLPNKQKNTKTFTSRRKSGKKSIQNYSAHIEEHQVPAKISITIVSSGTNSHMWKLRKWLCLLDIFFASVYTLLNILKGVKRRKLTIWLAHTYFKQQQKRIVQLALNNGHVWSIFIVENTEKTKTFKRVLWNNKADGNQQAIFQAIERVR